MSTCTNLINAINAVVLPPNFNDISSSCAVLSLTGTNSLVQLSGGGTAVLSSPSSAIDGRVFTVTIAGKIGSASGASAPQFIGQLYLGNSTSTVIGPSVTPNSGNTSASAINFWIKLVGVWDSTSQKVTGTTDGAVAPADGSSAVTLNTGTSPFSISAAAYSNVEFCFAAHYNSVISGSPTLTLTQFSFEYA